MRFAHSVLLSYTFQIRNGFKRLAFSQVNNGPCQCFRIPHFAIFAKHFLQVIGAVSVKHLCCSFFGKPVHPHIQRTIEPVTETAFGGIKLPR